MSKKAFENYQEYLKSDKWKQLKKEFTNDYLSSGWTNVCEVTGEILDAHEMHHHHFRYPKDWNDDSPENIVLISKQLHEMIHGKLTKEDNEDILDVIEHCPYNPQEEDLSGREEYLSYLRKWNIEILNLQIDNVRDSLSYEENETLQLRMEVFELKQRLQEKEIMNNYLLSELLKKETGVSAKKEKPKKYALDKNVLQKSWKQIIEVFRVKGDNLSQESPKGE